MNTTRILNMRSEWNSWKTDHSVTIVRELKGRMNGDGECRVDS